MESWTSSWTRICARLPALGGNVLRKFLDHVFTEENVLALILALLLVLIFMFGIDTSPTWIYQGF